jgi:glucan biosynthesis protein C
LVHLAITYGSPVGFWYYQEGQAQGTQGTVYILFEFASQAFYMGLLFLISGYFTPTSYEQKSPKKFLKDRLIRLGIPLIVFSFVIDPIMEYVYASATWFHGSFSQFLVIFISVQKGIPVGPLWFLETLLLFTFAYVGWKFFSKKSVGVHPIPSKRTVLIFALILAVVTFAVRLVFPIGSSFGLLGFQFCYFAQYIALFIVGLAAFRGNWFMEMPKETGWFWAKIALMLLILLPFILLGGTASAGGNINVFFGGLKWQSAVYAFWEQIFCVAVIIGLTVLFRERLNIKNRLTEELSKSSYAAYVFQAPTLVFLALAVRSIELPLLLKFALFSPIAVSLCFLSGFLIRKILKVDRVL